MTHPHPKLTALARERIARAKRNRLCCACQWSYTVRWHGGRVGHAGDRWRSISKRKERTPMPRRDLATIDPRLAKFCESLARDIGIPVDKLYRRSLYYSDRTVNRLRRQRYRRTHPLRTAWLTVKWWVR